jgi:hypothetical protein
MTLGNIALASASIVVGFILGSAVHAELAPSPLPIVEPARMAQPG